VYSCQARRRPSVSQRRRFRLVCWGLAAAVALGAWAQWGLAAPESISPALAIAEVCVYSERDAGFGVLDDGRSSTSSSGSGGSSTSSSGSGRSSSSGSSASSSSSSSISSGPSTAAETSVTVLTFHAGWREVKPSRWSPGAFLASALGRRGRGAASSSSSGSADGSSSSGVGSGGVGSGGSAEWPGVERVPKPPGFHNWRGSLHASGFRPSSVVVLGGAFVWRLDDEVGHKLLEKEIKRRANLDR
jgi:hypothetical protein